MNITKANKRDKNYRKSRYGHKVSGKAVFLIAECQAKRDAETIERGKRRAKNSGKNSR